MRRVKLDWRQLSPVFWRGDDEPWSAIVEKENDRWRVRVSVFWINETLKFRSYATAGIAKTQAARILNATLDAIRKWDAEDTPYA